MSKTNASAALTAAAATGCGAPSGIDNSLPDPFVKSIVLPSFLVLWSCGDEQAGTYFIFG
jgi:hypothetical protein